MTPAGRRPEAVVCGGVTVPLWVAGPAVVRPSTRLVVVIHGTLRNAADYIESWAAWARDRDRLVVAPEFTRRDWPGARSFNLGNVLSRGGAGTPIERERQSFSVVDAARAHLHRHHGLADEGLDIWGHSAGAQFVHRFLLFRPRTQVRTAIAAGAGWFTQPDLDIPYPYGLAHPRLGLGSAARASFLAAPLIVMRGRLDRERDEHLRTTARADSQGRNRFERAAAMVRAGHAADPACAWRLVDVPDAGHDERRMAPAAQAILDGR